MNRKLIMAFGVILAVLISSVYAYTNYYEITGSDVVVRDSNVTIYDSNVTIVNSTQPAINITYSGTAEYKKIPQEESMYGNSTWYWYIYKVSSEKPLDVPWAAQIGEKLYSSFYAAFAPSGTVMGPDKYNALSWEIGPIGHYDWNVKVLINGTLTDTQLSSLTKDVEYAVTSG